jgi:hypothetical protein
MTHGVVDIIPQKVSFILKMFHDHKKNWLNALGWVIAQD